MGDTVDIQKANATLVIVAQNGQIQVGKIPYVVRMINIVMKSGVQMSGKFEF